MTKATKYLDILNEATMHVYFVRHGETDLNIRNLFQSPSTPLNERGFDQARTVGEYLRPMSPTILVTSGYERAQQTARTISVSLGISPVVEPLFREVEWPSNLIERSLFEPRGMLYIFLSGLFRNSTTWHYRDGENYADLYDRIQRSFQYIESLTEAHESIAIVSHSEYINLMILYMCHGKQLSLREYITTLLRMDRLKNGEVVHVEYVGPAIKGACPWLLHTDK